ncbi:MAG: hypothetical protein IJP44_13830 [Bacteroidales bacterium]|nr:hypothetical protein [Bacteroidales bacterium]
MKTDHRTFAAFLAAAVWADGEYDKSEKAYLFDLAEDMELPTIPVVVEKEIKATENMTEEEINEHLEKAAKHVFKGEEEGVLTLCLHMLCANAVLSQDEVDNFIAFAEILGVDEERANTILDEFVNEEEDLIVEGENTSAE